MKVKASYPARLGMVNSSTGPSKAATPSATSTAPAGTSPGKTAGSKAEMTAAAEALGQALDQLQLALDGGQSILTEGTATLRALELEHPADSEEKR